MRGPTGICVFEGEMGAAMYVDIIKNTLKPFIHDIYPDTPHCFFQDSDPKHTSRLASNVFTENGVEQLQNLLNKPHRESVAQDEGAFAS